MSAEAEQIPEVTGSDNEQHLQLHVSVKAQLCFSEVAEDRATPVRCKKCKLCLRNKQRRKKGAMGVKSMNNGERCFSLSLSFPPLFMPPFPCMYYLAILSFFSDFFPSLFGLSGSPLTPLPPLLPSRHPPHHPSSSALSVPASILSMADNHVYARFAHYQISLLFIFLSLL